MNAYEVMSETKAALQESFRAAWRAAGRRGAAGAATGVGKTKPAIDEMMALWRDKSQWDDGPPSIFVGVPTEEMRDVNWPDEVKKWYGEEGVEMWESCVTAVCYASMHKYSAGGYRLVILDECHHLTVVSAQFFNLFLDDVDVMALSATYPDRKKEEDKWLLLKDIAPLVFTYPLDQGVEDGIITPFEFHVVKIPLDNIHKNIEAGPAKKRYLTTEAARYNTLSNTIKRLYGKKQGQAADLMIHKRRSFLCNLPSKLKVANALVFSRCSHYYVDGMWLPTGLDVRTIVFCGSIAQANALFGNNVYHSKAKAKKGQKSALDRFREKELNTLGVVNAVNEGINIPDLDQAIIIQMDSNPRTLTQRVGRVVRWREGHVAMVWILVTWGSQDQVWFEEAIRDFDQSNVIYHEYTEFVLTL